MGKLQTLKPLLATRPAPVSTGSKRFSDPTRGSRHERGYGYAWVKTREQILKRDSHLCQPCRQAGRLTVGNAVDHKVPKAEGGTDDHDNLQTICDDCHAAKTSIESARARFGVGPLPVRPAPVPRLEPDAAYPSWLAPRSSSDLRIVFGPPGSGKSQLVAEKRAASDLVIDLDEIIAQLSGQPIYQADRRWLGPALAQRNDLLDGLRSDQRAWFITTGYATDRQFWIGKLKPARVIVMNTKALECVRRVRADDRRPEDVKRRHIGAIYLWWRTESVSL